MKRCSTQLLKRSISPANSMILFSTCWFSGRKSLLCTEGQFQLSIMGTITTLSSVQSLSRVQLFVIRWTAACQDSVSITKSRSLLKLMSIALVMPSNHLILCRPLLLSPSIFPNIRVFFNELVLCIRWPSIGVTASALVLPMNIQD